MLPLRFVLDTNVVVSATLKPESIPRTIVLLALTRPARWYVSREILAEYEAVLARPELRISRTSRRQLMQLIRNRARLVEPKYRLEVTQDPDDNIFLQCADAARADYLVTGNMRHFPGFWKSTKVITPREFLSIVSPHLLS
jgi:putative PIN family toxin of toxin-antitoxin system